jgi:beta-glucosidase-like glycosyl hydrolase/CubicO group peptidase (beta-lactamase class C family)
VKFTHLWGYLLPLVLAACASGPAETPPVVAKTLSKLTLEEKAGQLFVCWSLSRPEGDNHEQMMKWVEDVGLGGVILSLGTTEDAATLIPKLQAKAKVPLLLASDFEGGVWWRLKGGTELGNQMLVGASESEELAEAMGRVTGQEAKALGFHWVFAPVLDVNSNPDNPIINVRSFGEDPELVSKLGRAFARGVRTSGLLSCGKHFPGHGDVDSDSHLALPTVPGDRERLMRVELAPFRAAARDGLESVMTGHLAVPGLGEDPAVPATLSRKILHDVLREELGFTGLVVTDALDMGGVKNALSPGEVAVRALLAGADVLLMPPEPLVARQAVVDAVRSGRVPMARLDDAVRRILESKHKVGLFSGRGQVAADWQSQIRTEESEQVADTIADNGLVLVRDRDSALQRLRDEDNEVLRVTLVDKDDGSGSAVGVTWPGPGIHLTDQSSAKEVTAAIAKIDKANTVLLSLFVKVRELSGGIGLPANLAPVLHALRDGQDVTVVSFGSPYVVRNLPTADAFVAAFATTERVQAAVSKALATGPFRGRLPVGIPGVAPAGFGLTGKSEAIPAAMQSRDSGLDDNLIAALKARLQQAVADGATPGAVCMVAKNGVLIAKAAVGRESYASDSPSVRLDTAYDLASLTKVCATTPSILALVKAGKLSFDDPVQKWVPEFVGAGKERVTVRHLMAHQGGLASYVRYFRTLKGKRAIVSAAAKEGLMSEPGKAVRYSDLGFILLMAVVEAASGKPFEEVVSLSAFPLATGFASTSEDAIDAAPTELDTQRGGVMRGYVHDENAYAMGGVSGHAGLFATAAEVLTYGTRLLAGGEPWLSSELIELATKPAGISEDVTRGLGFQLLQSGGWAGSVVPRGTFGHTGFTGTSLWCCPEVDTCVVLLTNRVHPTRVNNQITAVRRDVHDIVLGSLH